MQKDENGFPRRIRLDLCEPVEKALYEIIQDVEKMGADTTLTEAIVLLGKARDLISDVIDKRISEQQPDTEAKSVAPASDDPDGGGNHPTNPGGKP